MIGLPAVYLLAGIVFGAIAILSAFDRANPKRWANALFWGLFATSFLLGDYLGDLGNGVLVLCNGGDRGRCRSRHRQAGNDRVKTSAASLRDGTAIRCSSRHSPFRP